MFLDQLLVCTLSLSPLQFFHRPLQSPFIDPESVDRATMSDLPQLLLASLNPSTRKQAEQRLNELSVQSGFLTHTLGLILDTAQEKAVRLSASVYLKNMAKMRWEEVSWSASDWDATGASGKKLEC